MISLREIAEKVQGNLIGSGEVRIHGLSGIRDAGPGELTFLTHNSYRKFLPECKAAAIIVGKDFPVDSLQGIAVIIVDHPAMAYLKTAELFMKPKELPAGIDGLARVSHTATVSATAYVGPYVYVGPNSVIGDNVILHPFTYVGENVDIQAGTIVYPHAVIYDNGVIGRNVTIHSGAVIGSDGFGYIWDGKKHAKIPQIGKVVIEDDVEVGANTTIDRASLGHTTIRKGTKIDNQVQIAHNVTIGEHSIIVSQVGIAGSTTIGRNVVLAGQTGVRDHAVIGDNVMAGGRTGITGNVPSNSIISGNPHMPHKEWLRLSTYLKKLPHLFERMKHVEDKLHQEDRHD